MQILDEVMVVMLLMCLPPFVPQSSEMFTILQLYSLMVEAHMVMEVCE